MTQKRVRFFAEPNGSGKTSLINKLNNIVQFGVYINADDIEKSMNYFGFLSLMIIRYYLQSLMPSPILGGLILFQKN